MKLNNVLVAILINLAITVQGFAQWEKVNSPTYNFAAYSLHANGDEIYLLGSEYGWIHYTNSIINNWIKCDNGVENKLFKCITTYNDELYIGGEGQIFHSNDKGLNWTASSIIENNAYINAIAADDSVILAGHYNGVSRSVDGGLSWSPPNNQVFINHLLIHDTMYYAGSQNGLYRSVDRGVNWQKKSSIPTDCMEIHQDTLYLISTGDGIYKTSLQSINPVKISGITSTNISSMTIEGDNFFVGTTDSGLYLSTNRGNSFINIRARIKEFCIYNLAKTLGHIYVSTSGGMYFSQDNGLTWKPKNQGISGNNITGYAVEGNEIFGIGSANLLTSDDNGINWCYYSENRPFTDPSCIALIENHVMVGTHFNGIYVIKIGEDTWFSFNQGLPPGGVYSFVQHNGYLYTTNYEHVYRTDSIGGIWSMLNNGLPVTSVNKIYSHDNILYLSTGEGIFTSNDNGNSWSHMASMTQPVYCVGFKDTDIYIGSIYAVYKSIDKGLTWIEINGGLEFSYPGTFATDGTHLFIATNNGCFMLNEQENYWININSGTTFELAHDIEVINNNLYISTEETYRRSISNILGLEATPVRESLKVYPNPATEVVSIQLPIDKPCTLELYNSQGQLLQTCMAKGLYQLTIDNLPTGIYNLKARNEQTTMTQKFIKL